MPNNPTYQNNYQDERLKVLENHIVEIKDNSAKLCASITEVKGDVAWLKKFFWVIATASVASLVSNILDIKSVVSAIIGIR